MVLNLHPRRGPRAGATECDIHPGSRRSFYVAWNLYQSYVMTQNSLTLRSTRTVDFTMAFTASTNIELKTQSFQLKLNNQTYFGVYGAVESKGSEKSNEFGVILLRTGQQKTANDDSFDDNRLNTQLFQSKLNNQP